MGNRDVATAAGAHQRAKQRSEIFSAASERDVHRSEPERPERGVLHDGRERMGDGVAEDSENA
jgi:hypothetical protein